MKQIFLVFVLCTLSLASCGSFSFYSKQGVEQKDLPDMTSARAYLKQSGQIALANYSDTVNSTGWAFIHIVSNEEHADLDQAYSAGFLEGYLTRQHIHHAYLNFVNSVLLRRPNLSEKAYEFINNQTDWLKGQCANITEDKAYWSVVCTVFQQVWGLYDGYTQGINADGTPEKLLDFDHFYYLTNMGDLEDIVPAFNDTSSFLLKGRKPTNGDCSIFIKMLPNDLVCSHNTHNIYSLMLRIYKTYELHLQNPASKAKRVSFSSRPGDLESKDDFYNTDSGLVVMETSLNTYNTSNYGFLHYDSVPVWLRAQVATRMAHNSSHWATIFQKYRSGTHNSQWLVVDMNKYRTQRHLPKRLLKDIVWMCEEYYYVSEKFDVTQSLLVKQGYVAGYNTPMSQSIIDVSQYPSTWDNDTRAIIFKNHAASVTSIEGAKDIIRLNANDTGNFCEAIAPRCDAITKAYDFGAIDGKAISYSLLQRNEAWLVSSPSFNDMIPAFDWRKFPAESRYGMPDVYNFTWGLHRLDIPSKKNLDAVVIAEYLN